MTRTERKKIEQKSKIIEISIKLIREYGFYNVSMEEIAKQVDISKGTLYNYFSTKEEILSEFIKNSFAEKYFDRILCFKELPTTLDRVIHIYTELMNGVIEHKDIFKEFMVFRIKNILSFNKSSEEESGLGNLAKAILKMSRDNSELIEDIPDVFVLDFFEFTFIEIAKSYYNNDINFNLTECIKVHSKIFARCIIGGKNE